MPASSRPRTRSSSPPSRPPSSSCDPGPCAEMPRKKHAGVLPQGKEMCLNCCQAKREEERQLGETCWEKTKELPPGAIGCPEVPGWSSRPCYGDSKTAAHFSDGRARYSSKGQKQGCTYFTFSFFEIYPKAALRAAAPLPTRGGSRRTWL